MDRIINAFRWEYGIQRHHYVMIFAVLFGIPYMIAAYTEVAIPTVVGMASVIALMGLIYGLAKADQAERKTIAAWSFVSMFAFSGLANFLPGTHMETIASIALVSVSAAGMIVFGVSLAGIAISIAYNRYTGREGGNGGSTVEERVLTEPEYENFKPHPYENEFVKIEFGDGVAVAQRT